VSGLEPKVWRDMGLTDSEYEQIKKILGREPNYVEVGMFAVMWSEHCGYKNSRPVLKMFPTKSDRVLQGPGENAGIVDIGDGLAVVFKVESHNHPSAVEPFQGAATGVGGIVRDIFTMGARPIASLNSLRFGSLDNARVRYLLGGVVAGIAAYGNCLGVPTVGGEVYFHPCYEGNPLVNAMCVGLIEHKHIARGVASGVGNPVMVVGAKTGRDGIHGATFASEELSEASASRRPSVQVGDPFMEKLLIEACLEIIHRGLVGGIQDMGAAGLTSSSCEMAARGGSGMEIDVALVPRREEGMTPYEVMLSESQERMLLVPKQGCEDQVGEVFTRWGLDAVVVGRVTEDGLMRIKDNGVVVAEVPAKALTDECPVYYREEREPEVIKVNRGTSPNPPEPDDYNQVLRRVLGSSSVASKEWVYRQYDHMVQVNTAVRPGSDAAVLRVKGTNKGLAMTIDCNSRYCYLDPFRGGAIAVAEAARNLVCSGAQPLAITDCLNFGNPEKPEVFWQFRQSVSGMTAACNELGIPVVSGNVSLYNETNGEAIYPTPVVGMVGLIDNIDLRMTQGFKEEGDVIVLLGDTLPEIGGSEYLYVTQGQEIGQVPDLDLAREQRLQECCLELIKNSLMGSAHDCSEGGLGVALVESCISGGIGANVALPTNVGSDAGASPAVGANTASSSGMRPDYYLFSESQSRVLISIPEQNLSALKEICDRHLVPFTVLGRVGGDAVVIRKGEAPATGNPGRTVGEEAIINMELVELEKLWRGEIERWMG